MLRIILNNNNYKNKKQINYNKQNPGGMGGEQTIILIYYIQTMKRLPCLICDINFMLIKPKRGICL